MLKSELAVNINTKFPELKESDVALALDCILGQMTEALVQGERIEIRGFGSFSVRHRPLRTARNPKNGEFVHLSAKTATHFKPGKAMREKVNKANSSLTPSL